jgi:hypothetical protein
MAEEMVEYSKNNILAQAGQSMLAQANTAKYYLGYITEVMIKHPV